MEKLAELDNKDSADWLRMVWQHYGQKTCFELTVAKWISGCPNLMELIEIDKRKHRINAFPCKQYGDLDSEGTPNVVSVEILPATLTEFKSEVQRGLGRQTTVDGKSYDLRNGTNQNIWTARTKDLAATCECWIRNLSDPYPRKRNASERCLQTAISLRGEDLETDFPDLYQQIRQIMKNGPQARASISNGSG